VPLGSGEQPIPLEVYAEVIEVAMDSRQWNALDQFQRRACGALCIDSERRVYCHKDYPGTFHVLSYGTD
jgi:hypothetical protein